jgi:hypothetical protein
VFQNAVRKIESFHALMKFFRPTKTPMFPDARVGEREPHAHHERIGDEQPEEDHRRGEQDEREQPLVLEEARPSRRAGGAGMGEDGLETDRPSRAPRDVFFTECPSPATRRSS